MGTADGLLHDLSGPGTIRASVFNNGTSQLQLWSSLDLPCQSESDTLPYTAVSCTDTKSITTQLGINKYYNASGNDDGQLEIYIYDRDSGTSPGTADEVDRLNLTL